MTCCAKILVLTCPSVGVAPSAVGQIGDGSKLCLRGDGRRRLSITFVHPHGRAVGLRSRA